ncbi:MAG: hypothetical protein HC767_07645 [Akkermansiaceae bacterium]|nr:hypothetical protein [Akkermansiaceae bacterium]
METTWLKDTAIRRCAQQAVSNGLLESYSGALVALQGVAFPESAAQFQLYRQGNTSVQEVFYSDITLPVAGSGQQQTVGLQGVAKGVQFLAETDSELNEIKLVRCFCDFLIAFRCS